MPTTYCDTVGELLDALASFPRDTPLISCTESGTYRLFAPELVGDSGIVDLSPDDGRYDP